MHRRLRSFAAASDEIEKTFKVLQYSLHLRTDTTHNCLRLCQPVKPLQYPQTKSIIICRASRFRRPAYRSSLHSHGSPNPSACRPVSPAKSEKPNPIPVETQPHRAGTSSYRPNVWISLQFWQLTSRCRCRPVLPKMHAGKRMSSDNGYDWRPHPVHNPHPYTPRKRRNSLSIATSSRSLHLSLMAKRKLEMNQIGCRTAFLTISMRVQGAGA